MKGVLSFLLLTILIPRTPSLAFADQDADHRRLQCFQWMVVVPSDQGVAVVVTHRSSSTLNSFQKFLESLRPGDTLEVTKQNGDKDRYPFHHLKHTLYPVDELLYEDPDGQIRVLDVFEAMGIAVESAETDIY